MCCLLVDEKVSLMKLKDLADVKFACGRESVVDEIKRPGRCVVSATDAAIAAVKSLIRLLLLIHGFI